MKKYYQSRTIWLNAITLLLAILALPEFISLIPETALRYIAFISATGNIVLRFLTTQPIE